MLRNKLNGFTGPILIILDYSYPVRGKTTQFWSWQTEESRMVRKLELRLASFHSSDAMLPWPLWLCCCMFDTRYLSKQFIQSLFKWSLWKALQRRSKICLKGCLTLPMVAAKHLLKDLETYPSNLQLSCIGAQILRRHMHHGLVWKVANLNQAVCQSNLPHGGLHEITGASMIFHDFMEPNLKPSIIGKITMHIAGIAAWLEAIVINLMLCRLVPLGMGRSENINIWIEYVRIASNSILWWWLLFQKCLASNMIRIIQGETHIGLHAQWALQMLWDRSSQTEMKGRQWMDRSFHFILYPWSHSRNNCKCSVDNTISERFLDERGA